MEIGSTLKAARESRGISLETAEENTKIRRKYLEALESESFALLPGRVYVKGFIKNYARFLGLNPDGLVAAYEEKFPSSERDEEKQVTKITSVDKTGGGKLLKAIIGLIAVGLLAVYIYQPSLTGGMNLKPSGKPGGAPAEESSPAKPEITPAPAPVQPRNDPVRQQGVNVTLNITDNESWLRVDVDGSMVFEGTLPAGEKKEFKGKERINLRIGNAGAVQVEFNGQKMGVLGGFGQVVNREFNAPQG